MLDKELNMIPDTWQPVEETKGSFETMKDLSNYHFDPFGYHPNQDCILPIGRFRGDWSDDLKYIIEHNERSTWRNRRFGTNTARGDGGTNTPPEEWIRAEELDIERAGGDPNVELCGMAYELPPTLQKMCDLIGLEAGHDKAHVQVTGQCFTRHIDKLGRIYPADTSKIMRIVVMLTDWEPGHFYTYGNFTYEKWRAGDIHWFDHMNVPHCTANAGLSPRCTIVTTGIRGPKTEEFLKRALQEAYIDV